MSSKTSAKLLRTKLNIPLALTLSVIPDIDILIPILQHRGPAHSIITASIAFISIFIIYRIKAAPYFIALIQHFLGDYIAGGGIQILWPLKTQYYGAGVSIKSPTNITLEWILFLASIAVMLKIKDTTVFLKPQNSNLVLTIPTFTVLLPTFLAFPMEVPPILILPHIAYLALFLTSILIYVGKPTKRACKLDTKSVRSNTDTQLHT